jgi:hypothetical protein
MDVADCPVGNAGLPCPFKGVEIENWSERAG